MTIPTSDLPSNPPGAASPRGAPADWAAGSGAKPGGRGRRQALHFSVVLLGASALASLVGGLGTSISVALGVALAGANLLLMHKITSAMMASAVGAAPEGAAAPGGRAVWGLLLPFKLVALVGVAYALVSSRVAQPVPLAMGFALLPLTGVFLPRPTSMPDLANPQPRRRRSLASPRDSRA